MSVVSLVSASLPALLRPPRTMGWHRPTQDAVATTGAVARHQASASGAAYLGKDLSLLPVCGSGVRPAGRSAR